MTPTKNVQIATVISAVIGLVAWIVAETTGIGVPSEIVGSLTTLVTGIMALVKGSAKVAAGAMSSALVAVIVWAVSQAGVEIPVDAAASLNSLALFVFAWITTDYDDA